MIQDSPQARAAALEKNALRDLFKSLEEYDAAIAGASSERAKGQLRADRYRIERRLSDPFPWASQAGQDRWVDQEVFKGKKSGVFVEVGAYDGLRGSNTLFFESLRGWTGLLIEPSPHWAAIARAQRTTPCLELAVGAESGHARFLEVTAGYTQMSGLLSSYDAGLQSQVKADERFEGSEIDVKIKPLHDILREQKLMKIDYISLDVEGAEVDVLRCFPFDEIAVGAWSVENNTSRNDIPQLMGAAGYIFSCCLGVDEIWINENLI